MLIYIDIFAVFDEIHKLLVKENEEQKE